MPHNFSNQNGNEVLSLAIDSFGKFYPKCQLTDYKLRGTPFESSNIIDYFVDTYEEKVGKHAKASNSNDEDEDNNENDADHDRRLGCKRNERVLYLPDHPKYNIKLCVMRSPGH